MSHGAPIAIVRFSDKGRKDRFVRLAVATPHNDDFFTVAPLHHSAGIKKDTRVTWMHSF